MEKIVDTMRACEEVIYYGRAGWKVCGALASKTIFFRHVPPKDVCTKHASMHKGRENLSPGVKLEL